MSDEAKRAATILIGKALDDARPDGMALYTPALAEALLGEGEAIGPCPDNPNTLLVTGSRDGKTWRVRLAGWTP